MVKNHKITEKRQQIYKKTKKHIILTVYFWSYSTHKQFLANV